MDQICSWNFSCLLKVYFVNYSIWKYQFAVNVKIQIALGFGKLSNIHIQTGSSDGKRQVFSIWSFRWVGIKWKLKKCFTSTSKYGNRITNLVQISNSSAQSEMTLLKRQQDFSISAFQWGGVECKIKNMHHHFHCACIQVVANDHRNTIVTHTLIMKRTPHYVKVEKYQKVF